MKIVNFSIFLDKMGENNITRGLNMFYVIDKKTETGAQGFVVLNEKKDGAKRDYDEYPSRIHNFDNTREGSLQGIKYCANQRAINLDKHYDWYDALHEFFEILGENTTEDDVSLIEGVYNSFNLKKLKNNLENNIKKQKPREAGNNLFVYNLAKFPKILARMIGVNEKLCANLSKAILREDYQAAFNLLSEDNVKSSDVAGTNDEIDVWKYVSFNENSSYNSITSYEYIDQDIYKKETFIDQDTYIPTIFKHYNPTRNSYKYNGRGCIEIQDEQLSKRVTDLENYIWGLKYIPDGDDEKREYKKKLTTVFKSYKDDSRDSGMRKFQRFDNLPNYQDYKGIARYICDLVSTFKLDANIKYILMPYPSSKMGDTNIVQIISKILGNDPIYSRYFIDGSDIIERIADEASAHVGNNKGRNATERMKSLEIKTDKVKQYEHENVIFVVFDDVTTTGSSLEALDRLLQGKGIKNIVNFVFGKSIKWYSFIERKDFKFNSNELYNLCPPRLDKVENIIWDLDNTLKAKYKDKSNDNLKWYDGLDKIINNTYFKHIIATNRSKSNMSYEELELINSSSLEISGNNNPFKKVDIVSEQKENKKLYWEYDFLDDGSLTIKNLYFSKPSAFPVQNALYLFNKEQDKDHRYPETCKNTIGVGNNEADIAAYKRAGIYSVLVRWGNKAKIEDTFGADACFDTVEDFTKWLQSRM